MLHYTSPAGFFRGRRPLFLVLLLWLAVVGPVHGQSTRKRIHALLQTYQKQELFSGNVLVVQRGKTVFAQSYGLANREWQRPNASSTVFRIGSLTKQFTAALILQLHDEGKIDLQQPVGHYLPWLPPAIGSRVTIQHLLGHTSGLPNYTDSASTIIDINSHHYTPQQIALKFFTTPPQVEPGLRFAYCNTGYFLLGLVVEEIEKKPLAQALRERILQPANMTSSGLDDAETLVPNRAAGYSYTAGGYVHAPYINPYLATYAAGGMYTTIGDLRNWAAALFGGKLLSRQSFEQMTTPRLGNYGYGLYIAKSGSGGTAKTVIGHNGSISGFSCSLLRFVEEDVTVILLDNTRAEKRGNLENISAGISAILRHQPPKPPMPSAMVLLAQEATTGSGRQLVERYQEMKGKPGEYRLAGAAAFLPEASAYLLQQNRADEAVVVARFATEESPQSTAAWNAYAAALWQSGQKGKAAKASQQALRLNPGDPDAQLWLQRVQKENAASLR